VCAVFLIWIGLLFLGFKSNFVLTTECKREMCGYKTCTAEMFCSGGDFPALFPLVSVQNFIFFFFFFFFFFFVQIVVILILVVACFVSTLVEQVASA